MKYLLLSFIAIAALGLTCAESLAASINKIAVVHVNGSYALAYPIYTEGRVLAASSAESVTVPTDVSGLKANYVNFSAQGCDFHVAYDKTATVLSGDVTDGSASESNPTLRFIGGKVTTISVISPTACKITYSFFM